MAKLYKNLELEFAKVASLDPQMDDTATAVASAIEAKAPHYTGAFASSIKTKSVRTKRGVKDRLVYSDDPQAGIIEYGYLCKNGKWQPGHFVFNRVKDAFR